MISRDFMRASAALFLLGGALLATACGDDVDRARRLAATDDPEALAQAARIYQAEIDRLTALHQENVIVRAKLGEQLMARELFGEAVPHIRYAVKVMPTSAPLRLDLAICLANLAQGGQTTYTEAEDAYQKVLQLDPGSAAARYGLAMIAYTGRKDPAAALRLCFDCIRCDPDFTDAYILGARIFTQQGNLTSAIEFYSKALKRESVRSRRRQDILASYARVLEAAGRITDARKIQAELYPERPAK